jgi:hypothetical protein
MTVAPYRDARRVFWIVDNGSSHRGPRAIDQIEIYFSIVQRKVVTPNDFESLSAVEYRRLAFQRYYEGLARPFEWTFTRRDLAKLLEKLERQSWRQEAVA